MLALGGDVMKPVKFILISIISLAILVNCGDNESKKATTPTKPNCQLTNSCGGGGGGGGGGGQNGFAVYHNGNFTIADSDHYDNFLKSVYGSCDAPFIFPSYNIWETLIISGLGSALNRCSKWNDDAHLEIAFVGEKRVHIKYYTISTFVGQRLKLIIDQVVDLEPKGEDSYYYADLNAAFYPSNFQRNVSIEFHGDITSDHFFVYLDYKREEVARFTVLRVQ